jgi:hypothetical protein
MPCSPSTVRRVAEAPGPSGRAWPRLLIATALIVALVILARGRRLESRGRLLLGPGPSESYVFANRSEQPCLARIEWSDSSSAPIFMPPRSTTDVELPVSASGQARTQVWRVDANGPGAVEHVLEWTTAAGEEFTVTVDPAGLATGEVTHRDDSGRSAGLAIRSRHDRPVFTSLEELAAAGAADVRAEGPSREPLCIAPGRQDEPATTRLDAGRAMRLHYRIADLQLAASVKIDSREGASHEVVIDSNGSTGGGSLSLLTRAGY